MNSREDISRKRVRGAGTLDRTGSARSSRVRQKKKKGNLVFILMLVVCSGVLLFSGYKIADYYIQQAAADKGLDELLQTLGQDVPEGNGYILPPGTDANGHDSDTETPIKEVSVNDISLADIPYLNVNLPMAVEKTQNADLMGWFYFCGPESIYGLPINNALLKAQNNDYYLNHDIYKNRNENGAIYMDYRCYSDLLLNRNTVIYGHARSYRAFGGLKYLNNAQRWYLDANNHFIKVQTGDISTVWQIFSWYETTDTADYTRVTFGGDSEFVKYANMLQDRNQITQLQRFNFTENSRIMTLSTCKGSSNGRVAVHAVLVKYTKI